jgi:formyltetrahydrofolate-dependent phosphoribosylglycinamide formyltransferase
MVKVNTCIFISGKGTNLKKLILNSKNYHFPINIKLIICNNKNAEGLNFAKKWSIPYLILKTNDNLSENKILIKLKNYKIDLILLAGYMKILTKKFIRTFGKSIINIHPSLLPKFKGLNTFEKVLLKRERKTGCTVHFVTEKLDSGQIILKKFFYINEKDNIDSIKRKTQNLEYNAFSEAIIKVLK